MYLEGHQHPLDIIVLGLDHLLQHLNVLQLGGLEDLAVSDLVGEQSSEWCRGQAGTWSRGILIIL